MKARPPIGFTTGLQGARVTTDDEYIELVNKLSEKHTGEDPDEHIRRIVRQEIGKRTDALVGFVMFCGALWWAATYAKPYGGWLVIGLGIAWLVFLTTRWDRDPSTDRHLIVMNAEDRNRLHVIAETYEAGEQVWAVEEQPYGKRERTVVAVDNRHWEGSWERVYHWALELEKVGPAKRRKVLLEAATRAGAALEQGAALAKREDARLTLWAANYVHRLQAAKRR